MSHDILDGLAQVRATFMRENMRPPTAILLESQEEGMRFLSAIRQQSVWREVIELPDKRIVNMEDGSTWMQCEVMGISVRWPLN